MGLSLGEATRMVAPETQTLPLFATPVFRFFWPESDALNAELRQAILARMEESSGVVKTNRRGGWHSRTDLQVWPEECVKVFVNRVASTIRELVQRTVPELEERHLRGWEIEAWANVNSKGAYNASHNHVGGNNIWSGFYYVDAGAQDSHSYVGGRTILEDHSGTPREILPTTGGPALGVELEPQAGLMVVFPAGLYHSVEPYWGDLSRITVAFNLKHAGFGIPYCDVGQDPSWWWQNFRGPALVCQKSFDLVRAVTLLPRFLSAGRVPRTLQWQAWLQHFRVALNRATAEMREVAERKRTSQVHSHLVNY